MALGALDNKIESPSLGGGGGGSLKAMNPMESMVATFKDMRDGILDLMVGIDSLVNATKDGFSKLNSHLAYRFETIVAAIQMTPAPTAAESVAAADTDDDKPTNEGESAKGGMLDSLKGAFADDGGFGKLKKALFMGIVASLLLFSDQLKAIVVPILKVGKQIYEFLGPKGSLILGLGLLAAFTFPKTFFTILKVAFKVLKFIPTIISALSTGFSAVIVPLLPVIAIVAGIAAVIYSLKKGFDAFKESLDAGDSMIDAIIAGVSTALATLISLPATLFTKLVGFVAGLLGFDNVKEKLMNIDFVGAVTDSLKFMFTKAKDFVMSIFDIDFAGMFGKVLDIGKMIIGRIKAIGAAGFAAVKAAFPGGESPMEAFKRVYEERTAGSDGGGDSEPKEVGSINDAQLSSATEQTDVDKLVNETAEKTHEADESGNSKLSSTRKEERAAIMAEGFSKQDAKQIRLFDYSDKGFAKYFKTSMDTLGYAFESPFLSSAEKLAWMKDKAMPDDDGNMVKLSEGGEYDIQASPAGGGEMVAGSSSAAGEKLNEATAENKKAKDEAAGSASAPPIIVNQSTDNSSSSNNTTQVTKMSADHSDPTANTLKQLAGIA
jgi:hypothetical protein|tara:strand:+ start:1180 stop:2994 length:1815 start_codon:yes stop_codon:yes gene_type:complete